MLEDEIEAVVQRDYRSRGRERADWEKVLRGLGQRFGSSSGGLETAEGAGGVAR